MKKIRWMITVMVLAFLFLPMGSAEAGTKAGGYKLACRELSGKVPYKMTLTAGKKCTLRLKKAGTGKTVKSAKIKWKTSDKAVIKVQKKAGGRAVLSARKKGSATVTAVYQGRKYRCKVAVKKAATKTEDNGKTDGSGGNVPKVHKDNGTQAGADKPVLNAKEVSLYYYIKSDADVVPADPSQKDSFRLKVSGTKKEVKKWELSGEDAFYFEITDYGLVTLKHAPAYEDGSVSVKAEATLSDGTVLSAKVTGYSETNLYLDRLFQKFAKENITSGMTEKEKADRAARYIGEISGYEFYNDSWADIFLHGKGDCMASRHAMAVLCRYIGVKAAGCGSLEEHGKTVVKADGNYYIYTTGFNEPRPRSYMVSETTYDYLEEHEDELGIWAGYFLR